MQVQHGLDHPDDLQGAAGTAANVLATRRHDIIAAFVIDRDEQLDAARFLFGLDRNRRDARAIRPIVENARGERPFVDRADVFAEVGDQALDRVQRDVDQQLRLVARGRDRENSPPR